MDDVELVGVHDDGEHLVLAGPDGARYLLTIDEPLRAAVRRDRARLGQLQIAMGSGLRPKEIQARIRGGMSADEVAELAGLPIEHVLRYEGPVMAERRHVADRARGTVVHRSGGASGTALDDLVAQRMRARGVDGERGWDAWREEEGTWLVQVSFTAGGRARTAQWRYDLGGAHLEPVDDEARWLSARTDQDPGPLGGRRLTSVSAQEKVYDVEADGGVRPADADAEPARPPRERTVELLDALRGRRGRRQPIADPDADPVQGDLVDELLQDAEAPAANPRDDDGHDDPPPAHPPASRPEEAVDAEILALPEPNRRADDETGDGADEPVQEAQQDQAQQDEAQQDEAPQDAPQRPARARAKPRRASVPSWDDIVFGSKKD
jgi:hypothetical protein